MRRKSQVLMLWLKYWSWSCSYDFRSIDNLLLLILLHGRRIEQLEKCARRES
ncbi:heat shock protein 60 [Prunus dulcis]|uniref:Heat shock protein 60 n=1 Tax=Prunus dulcis TaxID=3755 RepID=A0A5H2XKP6_PRUDU|nr:heat shock protein 60 [Prunus dulcis]